MVEVSLHFEHLLVLSLVELLLVQGSLIRDFFVELVPLKWFLVIFVLPSFDPHMLFSCLEFLFSLVRVLQTPLVYLQGEDFLEVAVVVLVAFQPHLHPPMMVVVLSLLVVSAWWVVL